MLLLYENCQSPIELSFKNPKHFFFEKQFQKKKKSSFCGVSVAELWDKLAVSNRLHVYAEQQAATRCQPHLWH